MIYISVKSLKKISEYWTTWEAQNLQQTFFEPLRLKINCGVIKYKGRLRPIEHILK